MENREQLMTRGLRVYEIGRLRAAARASAFLAPLTLLCAIETGARETCACLGTLLLGISVFLRWKNRSGVESVTSGLVAGSIPLVAGLVVVRAAPFCAGAPFSSMCTAVCLAVGTTSGVWLERRIARSRAGIASWIIAVGVAYLTASLGCIGLGTPGVLGVGFGLLAGGALAALATSRAT